MHRRLLRKVIVWKNSTEPEGLFLVQELGLKNTCFLLA